jgi:hypothetical protein
MIRYAIGVPPLGANQVLYDEGAMNVMLMSPRKDERFKITPLSEYYEDYLRADAFLARNSLAGQAKSLLQAKLTEKEQKIKDRIAYLARKRGISMEDMWNQIQKGEAQHMNKDELAELQQEDE